MGYDARRFYVEQHIERQYYANSLRICILAVASKEDGKYPWEMEDWQTLYPSLSSFLCNSDRDYGENEADYFKIISDYEKCTKVNEWMLDDLYNSLAKDKRKYILPRPFRLKNHVSIIVGFLIGLSLGWLWF